MTRFDYQTGENDREPGSRRPRKRAHRRDAHHWLSLYGSGDPRAAGDRGAAGLHSGSLIRFLRSWNLWRVPSVIVTVLVAIAVLASLGSTIVFQVAQLADDLPNYENNLRAKIRALGGGSLMSSSLERATDTLKDLQTEISKSGSSTAATAGQKPLLVEVR